MDRELLPSFPQILELAGAQYEDVSSGQIKGSPSISQNTLIYGIHRDKNVMLTTSLVNMYTQAEGGCDKMHVAVLRY